MATEERKEPRKRGRPKSVKPNVVSEENNGEKLKMSNGVGNGRITIADVDDRMTKLFAEKLGNNTQQLLENLNTLQSHNPFLQNSRLKSISDVPGIMSGDELAKAIGSPQDSEQKLRKQGWALSASQYLYYKILRMSADVPLYKYYKTPLYTDTLDFSSKKFKEEDRFVDEWLNTFDMKNTLKRTALEVKREGKCVYILRNSIRNNQDGRHVNYCTWQKLPTNYVKLTGIGEHGYIASFNMLLFLKPAYNIDQYPDFIRNIWLQMLESGAVTENLKRTGWKYSKSKDNKDDGDDMYTVDPEKMIDFAYGNHSGNIMDGHRGIFEGNAKNYMFWVQLPQELCYVFASDTSNAWAVPDTIGLFGDLQNLTDYETLSGLVASTPLTAIFTAEVPMIGDSNLNAGADQTALSADTITGFQNKFNTSVSSNLDAYFAPFKNMKLQSLPNVPNSNDITTKATQNFITKSGNAGLIIATEKPSVSQTKAAQLLYEAECDFLTRQFESVLNMIINNIIGTQYKWRLHIWGGIYSFENEVKRDKEMFFAGASFVLPKLASAYDMTVSEVVSVGSYIDSMKAYDCFKTVTQAKEKEQSGGTANPVGRPAADIDTTESENTLISVDAGNNTSDTRDFSAGRCIICGEDADGPLCEDCFNEFYGEGDNDE